MFLAFVFVVILLVTCSSGEDVTIDTKLGQIQGTVNKPIGKAVVYSFHGIQYGNNPVSFRQSTVNTSKWNGIYDGTTFGPVCWQSLPPQSQPMNEQCLYLNIWTPTLNKSANLPIMFWIHGGGFESGAGSAASYDGINLVGETNDFIYVSINYRLGAFGFLANENLYYEDPTFKSYGGQNGVYDQIIALQWVKDYITDFGGDLNQITIFGESAGGLSVCRLLVSPLAHGLFNRGIIESGACIGPWGAANKSYGIQWCNEMLENASYPINNLTYLRSIPAQDFENKMNTNLWVTSVDDKVLLDTSLNVYSNLSDNNVLNAEKVIIGFNSMDGIVGFPWHGGARPTTNAEYKEFIARYVTNETQQNLLYNTYYPPSDFPDYPPSHNSYELGWFTMTGDCCLACPSLMLGELIDQQTGHDVYVYYFGGPGKNGSYYAPHGSELPFVFDDAGSVVIFDMPWDLELSNQMLSAWTNFAKYGVPNITDSINNFDFEWTLYSGAKEDVIVFEDTIKIQNNFGQNYRNDVCGFWFNEVGYGPITNICLDGMI